MAGIGFELKKIFKEESISSMAKGAVYSTVVTIGPTLLVVSMLVVLYIVLGFFSIGYQERELLTSVILYAFIFSVIISSPFNSVASRYIADKIFYEKYEDVLPSFYSGLFASILTGSILGIPVAAHAYFNGNVEPLFIWAGYGMFVTLLIIFFTSNYVVATKEYKIIFVDYLAGMALTFLLAVFLYFLKFPVAECILYGMTAGFCLIAFLLFVYIHRYFPHNSKNYWEYFAYCRKFILIFLANLCYTLGLYVHNFVFWAGSDRIVVADTFISSPAYDMASCLAMFSNISMIVIFTVMAETKFHDIYQKFNESVIGGSYAKIALNKRRMFRLLIQQVSYLVMVQAIISCIMFLIANTFLPQIGFSGLTLEIYPILSGAYLTIFSMYCNIIFLYYFDDSKGAFFTALIFFVVCLFATLVSRELSPQLYGIGAFIGALSGWTFGYFRIRYLEKHFDRHIFCGAKVVEKRDGKGNTADPVIYKAGKNEAAV